jgi:hypothetical protein
MSLVDILASMNYYKREDKPWLASSFGIKGAAFCRPEERRSGDPALFLFWQPFGISGRFFFYAHFAPALHTSALLLHPANSENCENTHRGGHP